MPSRGLKSKTSSPRFHLTFLFGRAILPLLLLTPSAIYAGSATWQLNPPTLDFFGAGDWNAADNWTPTTVPNGPADIATFGLSNTTFVSINATTSVSSIVFNSGASAYTINIPANSPQPPTLAIVGTGIINNSDILQHFFVGGNNAA